MTDGAVETTGLAVPVLRIGDEPSARRFYVSELGFQIVWEHRFAAGTPLYARIRRDATVLDLSGHPEDGRAGSAVWIAVRDVDGLREELATRGSSSIPEIDRAAPGGPTLTLIDPFGNSLRFCTPEP